MAGEVFLWYFEKIRKKPERFEPPPPSSPLSSGPQDFSLLRAWSGEGFPSPSEGE